ncbi:MAG: DUF47 domain-containing protein [Betaproteobacteria bacterium]|nr:DUF47 domain-containing protein [Betaproteobacteria bacterium]
MFGRFMPQEGKFFDLFNAHAEEIVQGGKALAEMMQTFAGSSDAPQDPAENTGNVLSAAERAAIIDAIEARADKITHDTVLLLHTTFITPLDRDEIHLLITRMDDILDLIQDVAQSMDLYDVRNVTPEASGLADITLTSCEHVRSAVRLLHSMENANTILNFCQEIDRLEGEADRLMRSAMARLFRTEPDVRQLIKLKEIYELLETITDRCEDVANILEGIVLENS